MAAAAGILNHHDNGGAGACGRKPQPLRQRRRTQQLEQLKQRLGHHLGQRLSHPAGDRDAEPGPDGGHGPQRVHQPVGECEQPGAVDLDQPDADNGSRQPGDRFKRQQLSSPGQRRNHEPAGRRSGVRSRPSRARRRRYLPPSTRQSANWLRAISAFPRLFPRPRAWPRP